jgi:non-ribosomal peptide synthetase component F
MTVDAIEKRSRSFEPFPSSALEESIVVRFRRQVAQEPAEIAVRSRSLAWSYGELDRLSNAIANRLLAARGDRLETLAIMMAQGPLAVAAILGVVKAGKIYVPLDPAEAPEQLAAMLQDADPPIILADAPNRQIAESFAGRQREVIGAEPALATLETGDPGLSLAAERPLYIYYTSGSTGAPKGVFSRACSMGRRSAPSIFAAKASALSAAVSERNG